MPCWQRRQASHCWQPRHTQTAWADNWSGNHGSTQSGNNLNGVTATNDSGGGSTNVNNINGIAATSSDGSVTVIYVFY